MTKDAVIRARTFAPVKIAAENIFRKLGMTPSEAINLFYQQVALRRGIPFSLEIPNKETQQVLRDTEAGKNLHKTDTLEQMFKELEI